MKRAPLTKRARKKTSEGAEGGDGGVGCGRYFPGDGLANDGKREDADDAEGAKYGHDVRKRDTLGHGNVGDGDVEGHGDWKKRSDQGDEKDATDGGLRDERLGRKKFDDECAEDGGENHQRKGDTENVPETLGERARGGNERLRPIFRDGDFDGASNGGHRDALAGSHCRGKHENEEENGGELEQRDRRGKKRERHRDDNDVERGRSKHGGETDSVLMPEA